MLEVEQFSLALQTPLETASGRIERREGFLVAVESGAERGVGESTPLPGWTESLDECRSALARASEIAEELDWGVALAKTDGPAARHGLALALADAKARAANEPVYRSIGQDRFVSAIPVNATVGDASPEQTATEARQAVDDGFDCVKLKAGVRDVHTDVRRVRAVRDSVGESVELRVDANGAWTRQQATTAIDEFADLDVSYVEQPLHPDDLQRHAALRGGPVDVALDESLRDHSIAQISEAGAADVVVLKPMALGGPDRAREIALTARDEGIEPILSTTIDAVVARTGAVHVAASLPNIRPAGLATADFLAEDLSPDPAPVEDGTIGVPQDKGLGLPDRPAG